MSLPECERCTSRQSCERFGRDVFMDLLGQCRNCKAMLRVGKYEHRDKNRAKLQTIQCRETVWAAHPKMNAMYTRARCPVCGAFPVRVLRWADPGQVE